MSTSKMRIVGRVVLAGLLLTAMSGCSSLTRSDDVRVSKDRPRSRVAEAAAEAAAAAERLKVAPALQQARDGAAPPVRVAPPAAKKGG